MTPPAWDALRSRVKMKTTFGSGIPLDKMARDLLGKTPEEVRSQLGDAFLLIYAVEVVSDDAITGRAPQVGGRPGGPPQSDAMFVFPVAKRSAVTFSFISLGRNEGNDLHVPHSSISRFHAYFRIMAGEVKLTDAKSANGTYVGQTRVPPQGDGDSVAVKPGAMLRFGDVACMFMDARGLLSALTGHSQHRTS